MSCRYSKIIGDDVSRETGEALDKYEGLLRKWNQKINLVGKTTIETAIERHFLDSAQLFPICANPTSWLDIGSGGGFPGLVVATLMRDTRPKTEFTLVEADIRKATFLTEVARALELRATIISKRIEEIPTKSFDVISARAVAPLVKLLDLAHRFAGRGGVCLFLKGANYKVELDEALKEWQFNMEIHQSATHSEAVVLELRNIGRV